MNHKRMEENRVLAEEGCKRFEIDNWANVDSVSCYMPDFEGFGEEEVDVDHNCLSGTPLARKSVVSDLVAHFVIQ